MSGSRIHAGRPIESVVSFYEHQHLALRVKLCRLGSSNSEVKRRLLETGRRAAQRHKQRAKDAKTDTQRTTEYRIKSRETLAFSSSILFD